MNGLRARRRAFEAGRIAGVGQDDHPTVLASDTLRDAWRIAGASGAPGLGVVDWMNRGVGWLGDETLRRAVVDLLPGDTQIDSLLTAFPARWGDVHREHRPAPGESLGPRRVSGKQPATSRAVIVAGGEGRRLRPVTVWTPKPLLQVGGVSVIESLIGHLRRRGSTDFVLCLCYRAGDIRAHLGDGDRLGVTIRYVLESSPLGTAGGLGRLDPTGAPFLVVNGDLLTGAKTDRLLAGHRAADADLTVATCRSSEARSFDVLETEGDDIVAIGQGGRGCRLVNAGIYAVGEAVLDLIEPDERIDMPELIRRGLAGGLRVRAHGLYESWADVGTWRRLRAARRSAQLEE